MTDILAPLREKVVEWLTDKWIDGHLAQWDVVIPAHECSRELESLLPALQQAIDALIAERDAGRASMQAENRALREAANALVNRMRSVEGTDEYRRVWQLSLIHGTPYSGLTWENEFNTLVALLDTEEPKS